MELKQYGRIVRKRIWVVIGLMLIFAVIAGVNSFVFSEKQYTASTRLIVSQNQDLSLVNGKLDLSTINSNIQLITTYKEIIRSPRIMNMVSAEYPDLGLNANHLIGKIAVSSVADSQVMSVVATDTSYARAANMVNAVSKVFQREIPSIMKVDNVNILDEADPKANAAPISSNPVVSIVISLIVSFMIGIGLAFLLDYLDDSVKTEEDILESAGLPTFARVPHVKNAAGRKKWSETTVRSEKNVSLEA